MEKSKKVSSTSAAVKEMERAQEHLDNFTEQVNDLTLDRMNQAPKEEVEPQTKLSQKEIEKSRDIYLKPERTLSDRQKFDENYRKDWEFEKEYVQFIAEHKELIGETIEIWTHPRGGVPAEFWKVPTNKPVWGPRHLAEQIRRAKYHRLRMDEKKVISSDGTGSFYGQMVADTTIARLTAEPVSTKKSIFMGSSR